jgi:hypothetical protein
MRTAQHRKMSLKVETENMKLSNMVWVFCLVVVDFEWIYKKTGVGHHTLSTPY